MAPCAQITDTDLSADFGADSYHCFKQCLISKETLLYLTPPFLNHTRAELLNYFRKQIIEYKELNSELTDLVHSSKLQKQLQSKQLL